MQKSVQGEKKEKIKYACGSRPQTTKKAKVFLLLESSFLQEI